MIALLQSLDYHVQRTASETRLVTEGAILARVANTDDVDGDVERAACAMATWQMCCAADVLGLAGEA